MVATSIKSTADMVKPHPLFEQYERPIVCLPLSSFLSFQFDSLHHIWCGVACVYLYVHCACRRINAVSYCLYATTVTIQHNIKPYCSVTSAKGLLQSTSQTHIGCIVAVYTSLMCPVTGSLNTKHTNNITCNVV